MSSSGCVVDMPEKMKNLSALYAFFAINCNKKHMEHVIAGKAKQSYS
jgi:hypothetical protein